MATGPMLKHPNMGTGESVQGKHTGELLSKPWRKGIPSDWTEKEVSTLMKKILKKHESMSTYMTLEEKDRGLTVLLVGPAGHGKSSMINGIFAAIENDEYQEVAVVKTQKEHATLEFRTHRPRCPEVSGDGEPIRVVESLKKACDNFNLSFADFVGVDKGENEEYKRQMRSALFGLLEYGHKAEVDDEGATKKVTDKDAKPQVEETTLDASCIIWVVDVQSSEVDLGYMNEIVAVATRQGIPQVLAVTKCDNIDEECSEPRNMYYSKKVEDKLEETAAVVGVPIYSTFPIKNYIKERNIEPDFSYQYLYLLQYVMIDVEAKLRSLQRIDKERRAKLLQEQGLGEQGKLAQSSHESDSDVASAMGKLQTK